MSETVDVPTGIEELDTYADAGVRLPSIRLIDDLEIASETARLTTQAPRYFWTEPASSSGFHHPICRQERGLWAHTLMLAAPIERAADALVETDELTRRDIDIARAAAVLHDQRKHGDPDDPHHKSVGDHDLRMGRVIREESSLPDAVAACVESHMSAWYDGPEPVGRLQWLVAYADLFASTRTITPAVPAPLPVELEGMGLTVVDI